MTIKILMPALSPTMTEGTLAKWLKQEGDKMLPGDVIAEIETDKATMEVEAVDEGVLGKILVTAGTHNVSVGLPIAIILEEGEDASILANIEVASVGNESSVVKEDKEQLISLATSVTTVEEINKGERIFASPLAKRIANLEDIDLNRVNGSGPHGRIIKQDVLEAKTLAQSNIANIQTIATITGRNSEEYRIEPISNMRRVIAKRLLESKQTIPHFYLTVECNIEKLLATRADINHEADENHRIKLSVNDFIIKACALALKDVPEANSSWDDSGIKFYNNVDIAVAVAIEGGLVTPILRNADRKPLSTLSSDMKELAKRAREGKLKPEEYQGGGFSISNLGMYGIKQFNAIINPPQSCILAVGASIKKPIIIKDQVTIAHIVELTLSCDHRIVDGVVGAKLLSAVKKYLEHPLRMLV